MNHSRIMRSLPAAGIAARERSGMREAAGRVFLGGVPTSTGIQGRVVVVGGGMAGAAVARELRLRGGTGVAVTLIERDPAYLSNLASNRVLSGERTLDSLQCSYAPLASRYGIKIVRGEVVAIDPVGRSVTLASGCRMAWDRLVVAPGVDFDVLPGLETAAARARVPHAWKAGPQTAALRGMITAMPAGGVFVLGIPAGDCRHPGAALERARIVADWLGRHRPGAKVVVLDGRPDAAAAEQCGAGTIEHHRGVSIDGVDAATLTVRTRIGDIRGDVLNLIPPQRAGKVIAANGLADAKARWTRVAASSFEACAAPGIHVIGDAAATDRAAGGAEADALACADAVLRLLAGRAVDPLPQPRALAPLAFDGPSQLPANDGLAEILARAAILGHGAAPLLESCA